MQHNEYNIGAAFQAIEDELIKSMIRNMDRHRAEETKEGIEWSMWQTEQLKALERYKKDNQKRYGKQFRNLNKEMGELIQIARQKGNMQQEIQILNAIRNGFPAKKVSQGATAEFFRMNDRKLEALIQATTNDMQRAETAVLRMANDDYRKAIFNAQVYANSGAGTYEKAVDMATKDLLSRGLNCVEYANGARHTLADYADMAIRTASKRAYLQGEGEKRQEWGIATVIMAKRGNPCPKCLPFVGKVLIDDVWSGGKKSDGPYPLMSKAIAAGLYHPRCKDSHTTYFSGISTADDTWTEKELEAVGQANKQEAEQQSVSRQIEKYGRLADYSIDEENQKRYAARREEWKKRQASVNNVSDANREKMGPVPDFSHMNTPQISEWAEKNLKTVFVDTKGANSEFVADAARVLAEFEQKMDGRTIEGLKVQFGSLPNGVYAKYDDKTRTLHLKKTGSKNAFEEAQKAENIRYRFKWKTNQDYHATETYSGTIWHELGHAVDVDTGQKLSKALLKRPDLEVSSVKISVYAGSTGNVRVSKRSEAWAENFAAYMEGGAKAREVPEEIREMIEGYFGKAVAKISAPGIMESGARITNLFAKEAEDFAKMYYDEIRSFSTDAEKIAGNLGKSEAEIRKIKKYLFEADSLTDPDTGTRRRFDPDCAIAQSWQRLMTGKDIKPHDRTLIEHELLEMEIKKSNPGISHLKAHELAAQKYNYGKEASEYYGNLEKHHKNGK